MPRKQRKRGGGARKIGRHLVHCARYKANKTREKNMLRRLLKRSQCKAVSVRVAQLQDYISGKTAHDAGRKINKG